MDWKPIATGMNSTGKILHQLNSDDFIYVMQLQLITVNNMLQNKKYVCNACNPPGLLQESLGPFGPEVSRECPSGVSLGVSLGPFGPRAPECPKSVPRVSPECPGHLFDTPGTLSGHFLDTPEPGARRAPETPRGTLPGHFGPEGPERLL